LLKLECALLTAQLTSAVDIDPAAQRLRAELDHELGSPVGFLARWGV
jgi:hypothetical protein